MGLSIWMVTGIQELTTTHVDLDRGSEASTGGGITMPVPEPVMATVGELAGDGSAVGVKGDRHSKKGTGTSYGFTDTRLAAAQFMRLDVKIQSEVPQEAMDADGKQRWIKLKQLVDLGAEGVKDDSSKDVQKPPEEYARLEGVELTGCDSDEHLRTALIESSRNVDWQMFEDYIKLEEAGRLDEKESSDDEES